jgi:uncharacterized membrane protein YtjA (UPF0391 family)
MKPELPEKNDLQPRGARSNSAAPRLGAPPHGGTRGRRLPHGMARHLLLRGGKPKARNDAQFSNDQPLGLFSRFQGGIPAWRVKGGRAMLRWAVIFFVIALVAALLGFGGIAAGAAGIAKLLFVLFLVVFVISLLMGLVRRV